jgi:hypothetical protein
MRRFLLLSFTVSPFALFAQPKVKQTNSTPSVKFVVEQVARDFYQNFNNIKGDTLNTTGSAVEFTSRVVPVGALSTSITKYVDPNSYSWQSTLFKSEEYETAAAKYKEYYRQINGATLTFYDKTSYKLSGYYDVPDENRAFASSILELNGTNHDLQLFKVEVALTYTMPEWFVKLMVYEKVADKDMRPTIRQ